MGNFAGAAANNPGSSPSRLSQPRLQAHLLRRCARTARRAPPRTTRTSQTRGAECSIGAREWPRDRAALERIPNGAHPPQPHLCHSAIVRAAAGSLASNVLGAAKLRPHSSVARQLKHANVSGTFIASCAARGAARPSRDAACAVEATTGGCDPEIHPRSIRDPSEIHPRSTRMTPRSHPRM